MQEHTSYALLVQEPGAPNHRAIHVPSLPVTVGDYPAAEIRVLGSARALSVRFEERGGRYRAVNLARSHQGQLRGAWIESGTTVQVDGVRIRFLELPGEKPPEVPRAQAGSGTPAHRFRPSRIRRRPRPRLPGASGTPGSLKRLRALGRRLRLGLGPA